MEINSEMNRKNLFKSVVVFALGSIVTIGCAPKEPDVIVNPPSTTTIVHDRAPSSPTVIVTPPASSSHTETHTETNTTPPPDTQGTSTSTTTTGGN